ncbi:hypothetical protein ACFL3S_07835 [Gemmatimonadota bacterium]
MTPPADLTERVSLGRTGIQVSRLGVGAAYGISREACLEAFDAGINYFFWGSVRTPGMAHAIRELAPWHRDELCVVLQSYVRRPSSLSQSIRKGIDTLRLENADILLLGWHEKTPTAALLEAVEEERQKGVFRHLAISSHNRPLFKDFLRDGPYDVFHIRYNAAYCGAEEDLFPCLPPGGGPGIVAFTGTCWGRLMNPKRMPRGQAPMTAGDCYRFVLSNPQVHVAISGPKNDEEMRHALNALASGPLDTEEMTRARAIGAHVHELKSLANWVR